MPMRIVVITIFASGCVAAATPTAVKMEEAAVDEDAACDTESCANRLKFMQLQTAEVKQHAVEAAEGSIRRRRHDRRRRDKCVVWFGGYDSNEDIQNCHDSGGGSRRRVRCVPIYSGPMDNRRRSYGGDGYQNGQDDTAPLVDSQIAWGTATWAVDGNQKCIAAAYAQQQECKVQGKKWMATCKGEPEATANTGAYYTEEVYSQTDRWLEDWFEVELINNTEESPDGQDAKVTKVRVKKFGSQNYAKNDKADGFWVEGPAWGCPKGDGVLDETPCYDSRVDQIDPSWNCDLQVFLHSKPDYETKHTTRCL